MAVFNWYQPGHEIVQVDLRLNIPKPFGKIIEPPYPALESSFFSPINTPGHPWKIQVVFENTHVRIYVCHFDKYGRSANVLDMVLVKLAMVNRKRVEVHQQMISSQ